MISFFCGRVLLTCEGRYATELLNVFAAHRISYGGLSVCGETLRVWIGARNEKRVCELCEAVGICLSVAERSGLPFLVRRYGRRSGILIGSLFAVLILVFSSRVVWSIRVAGNEALSEEQVLTMLSACGLTKGAYLPSLDTDAIENRMLTEYGEICWVSVNLKGTTARVEVLETVKGVEIAEKSANLVATRDGQIERIKAYDGHVCVSVGDVVREGDLLVSGVYDKGLLGYRVTRASGAIYARTVRHFSVEVPLESYQKVYTGREWSENYVKFFSSCIKVFANTRKMGTECDIIYRDNGIVLPDGSALPVGVLRVIYREYRNEKICLDGDAAMEEAFLALSDQLEKFVSETGAELLSKTIAWELDGEAYRISCSVVCVENIARTLEFDVVEKK